MNSRMSELLIPGMRNRAHSHNCELGYNGSIPSIICEGITISLDFTKIEGFMDNDDYSSLNQYIDEICERCTE